MMAQRRIVHTWCDVCGSGPDGIDVPATTFVIPLDIVGRPRSIDLCDTHEKELVSGLRAVLLELGRVHREDAPLPTVLSATRRPLRPSGGTAAGPRWFCPVVECASYYADRGYATRPDLSAHLRASHQLGVTEVADRYGDLRPGQRVERAATVLVCDVRGCGVSYSSADGGRPAAALGLHRWVAHRLKGSAKKKPARRGDRRVRTF